MLADKLLTAAGPCVIVAGMCCINDEARRWTTRLFGGGLITELTFIKVRAFAISQDVTEALRSYVHNDLTLVVFGVAAAVLVGFMIRT